MQPTEQDFEKATLAAAEGENWHFDRDEQGNILWLSEGSLALACVKAGYAMAAQPAPLADAELEQLTKLEQQATPWPWGIVVKGNTIQSHYIPGVCSGISPKSGNSVFIVTMRNALPGLLARLAQAEARTLPAALDEELVFILGRPNFWCAPYATALRALGQEIPTKAEQEQAAVLHWLLGFYLANPADWRDKVGTELERAQQALSTGKEPGQC